MSSTCLQTSVSHGTSHHASALYPEHMTSHINGHKDSDNIHKFADCCLLLKESTDMEGMH